MVRFSSLFLRVFVMTKINENDKQPRQVPRFDCLGATALNQFLLMTAFQLHFPISEFFKQLARETF